MPRDSQHEPDLGLEPPFSPTASPAAKTDLTIKNGAGQPLSPAQEEFNKRMKALEKARATHERKRARLDAGLAVCRDELMPLVEARNQVETRLIHLAADAGRTFKLTPRRREALTDLICHKIVTILDDPAGLDPTETASLQALHDELDPPSDEIDDEVRAQFEEMCGMAEAIARQAGVNLDLGGLEPTMDPAELERLIAERFQAAREEFNHSSQGPFSAPGAGRKRKPSKAALERERLKKEAGEIKDRDFKSLYKQLAKVLHPDLETDPGLKTHKEAWMKRLTAARAAGDLREMLAIEMEWLGEEAGNLAQATDDKLRVYAAVLKEQLAELKERTRLLSHEPEYTPLRRFINPYNDRLDAGLIKTILLEKIENIRHMAAVLQAGGPPARKMLHQWADQHARTFGF